MRPLTLPFGQILFVAAILELLPVCFVILGMIRMYHDPTEDNGVGIEIASDLLEQVCCKICIELGS